MKKPICYQDDKVSCASACIQMILLFFNRKVELKEIKKHCKSNDSGTTVYGIIQCFHYYQIEASAYHATLEDIQKEWKYPCVVHLLVGQLYHYCVVYGFKKNTILLGDPEKGLIRMSLIEFESIYQGVMIKIDEVGVALEEERYQSMMQFYIHHFMENSVSLVKVMVLSILLMIMNILASYYYQLYIDYLLEVSTTIFISITLLFVFMAILKTSVQYIHQIAMHSMQKHNNEQYIMNTMQSLLYLQPKDFLREKEAVLMNKLEGLSYITQFMSQLYTIMFVDTTIIIGIVIVLFSYDFLLGCFVLLFLLGTIFTCLYFMKKVQQSNRNKIIHDDNIKSVFLEECRNIRMIIQYSMRTFFKEKIQHFYSNQQYYEFIRNKDISKMQWAVELMVQCFFYIFMTYSFYLYSTNRMTLGNILFCSMLLSFLMEPIVRIVSLVLEVKQQTILFTRYKDLIPCKKKKKMKIKKIESIECSYISYSYDYHRSIFTKYDLLINESMHIEGENGCGKTTLFHLIMGFDTVDGGQILINGIDLQDIDLDSYYQKIIYLQKDPVFFHESVLFNIIGYQEGKREAVCKLLAVFNSQDIIDRLDECMEEESFSSGQLQIIMLTRALLRNPDVLIMDESISNVDKGRVERIFECITKEYNKMKIIIVSHHTKLVNLPSKYVIINKI